MNDIEYMRRAMELARNGWGKTNPNPLVGAVIVKNNHIIGEGYHHMLGTAHAEIDAISNSIADVEDATMYVNLEPCSHYGRTPPCSLELIKRKFKRVVVAMEDPNPKVAGSGIALLRENGIQVDVGIMKFEAQKLNDIFIKYITKKQPFVLLKYAMTLDGKTATVNSDSKWISGEASREYVHELRNRYSAILVGKNTVIKDNPQLTARPKVNTGINPIRVIISSTGILPDNANVLDINESKKTIIAVTEHAPKQRIQYFESRGADVIILNSKNNYIDIRALLDELYSREIDSIMVEGGGTVAASFVEAGVVDKVTAFIAPVIVGGNMALTPVMGKGVSSIKEGYRLKYQDIKVFGDDIMIEGYVNVPWEGEV